MLTQCRFHIQIFKQMCIHAYEISLLRMLKTKQERQAGACSLREAWSWKHRADRGGLNGEATCLLSLDGQDIWVNGDRELRRHCNNLSMGSEEGRYAGNTEMTRAYWAGLGG